MWLIAVTPAAFTLLVLRMTSTAQLTALVTGASSGIGRATVAKLVSAGWRVIAAARRTDRLVELQQQLGANLLPLSLDVTRRSDIDAAVAGLDPDWQTIDLLVNNAGLGRGLDKLHEGNPSDWDEMIDTNIKGLLAITRAIVPGMVSRGRGQIINIGSIAGREVYPRGNVYCATKHAVDAITKGLRIDLVDTPIRVATIDPGLVETEFSTVRFHGDSERARQVYKGYTPLSGDDIADTVLWIVGRPPHVQIAEVLIFPTAQAGSTQVHKSADT